MGFRSNKRKLLVDMFGERRVAILEEELQRLEKALEGAGVSYKDLLGAGDVQSLGDANQLRAMADLTETFAADAEEVMASEMTPVEKGAAVHEAASALNERLYQVVGAKGLGPQLAPSPVEPYLQQLMPPGRKSDDGEVARAVKELRTVGNPASQYVADLFEFGLGTG